MAIYKAMKAFENEKKIVLEIIMLKMPKVQVCN